MNAIEVLQKLDRETNAEVFITGGFVRDLIRKRKNKDIDVVVRCMPLNEITAFLADYGKVTKVRISDSHDKFSLPILVFHIEGDELDVQISLPRRIKKQGQKSGVSPNFKLKSDSRHRDFTINAMYLPIRARSRRQIIDMVGGVEAIKKRRIETVGNPADRLKESPIRIMRALSLSARFNYRISNKLITAIEDNRNLIALAKLENIRDELNDILLSRRPSKYLKLMNKLGLLAIVMPELFKCVGVKQDNRYHAHNVFNHCVYTCDATEPNLILRLAGLLHDIGKPDTRKEIDIPGNRPRVTFHRHELHSVKLARGLLERLRYSKETITKVLDLIQNHMYHYTSDMLYCTQDECTWARPKHQFDKIPDYCPRCMAPIEEKLGWSDMAVRRFITRVGINETNINNLRSLPLFKLREAERRGNGLKKQPRTEKQADFEERIMEVFNSSKGLTVSDLDIDGHIIMETFRLKPGQKIGQILKFLLEKVLEKPSMNERSELIKLTAEYLIKDKDGRS